MWAYQPTLPALSQHRLTFFVLPRSSFWSGRFFLLVCSVCAPHFSSCSQRFKNYALFGNSCTPLCLAELPLFWHCFSFKQLANRRISFSRPLVWHSLSSLFSGQISDKFCHVLLFQIMHFVWTMQLKNFNCGLPRRTRWRLHIVTEGFCNKHLHFENILSKCYYCEFIVLAILGLRTTEKEEMPNQKRN